MTYPLTVSMTPAFLFESDWLLRAQLRCLSEQTCKAFDVLLIDPHYQKRRGYMNELAERYKLNIVHVPYTPNQEVARRLDCAIFNAPYCYSESPKIVRYSCWRFVRPEFTWACNKAKTNVDFRFHSISPTGPENTHAETNHNTDIWNFGSDEVHWDKVPRRAGIGGATWGPDSDVDEPDGLFRLNCYGNYMVFREQWVGINGCDETWSATAHYEDMDFCIRAANAGMRCARKASTLFRLHHLYGPHSDRANVPIDHECKKNCDLCQRACDVLEPNRFDLRRRIASGEVDVIGLVWVCKTCHLCGPVYSKDCGEHTGAIKSSGMTQATVIPKYKIGRRLRVLINDMDRQTLSEKVRIFNDSYINPRYY